MSEKDDLLASLWEQRNAAMVKLEGVVDELARQPLVPSGWSLLDMANHLRTGEEFWIRAIAEGAEVDFDPDDPKGRWAWATPENLTLGQALARYREACNRSDAFIAGAASLEQRPARLPVWPFTRHWARSLRTILVHLIEETARHAGHLDIARELLDGRSGTLLDELQHRTTATKNRQP
jgi:uncharacterized damage-inducible protein DinB